MTVAYYNEHDPQAAAWLRELINHKHIAFGHVDERSIEDVRPSDLEGFSQHHFFAGIGGWSAALRLAGWPDDRPVWTGSCPCQPFSLAGARGGRTDERHLWPAWFHLISQCRPPVVFGEQVASALDWLDIVQTDLEGEKYAFGAADLCGPCVGAPHIRQRLYFVADSDSQRRIGLDPLLRDETSGQREAHNAQITGGRKARGVDHAASEQVGVPGCTWFDGKPVEWVECRDGKVRPIEPGTFPLAHGVPGRVGLLRGYGNAIIPQVAATFIKAAGY